MQQRCPTLFWYFCRQKKVGHFQKTGHEPNSAPSHAASRATWARLLHNETRFRQPDDSHAPSERRTRRTSGLRLKKKGFTLGVKNGSLLTIRPCSISQTIPIRPPASGGEQEEPLEGGRAAFTWTNGSVLKYYEPMVHNPDCSNVTPPEARKRTFDWGRQFGPWQSNSVHPHQNGLMFPKSDYSREEEKRIH